MTYDSLLESIKVIRNLSEVALILRAKERDELLPTVLELMLMELQAIIDEHCVVKDELA